MTITDTAAELGYSQAARAVIDRLETFIADEVIPAEGRYVEELRQTADATVYPEVLVELRDRAQQVGLWNLFLGTDGEPWSHRDFCGIDEVLGRSLIGPYSVNCGNPDAAVTELLMKYGSEALQDQWVPQLISGDIGGSLSITEPEVPSSDPTQVSLRIEQAGDELVVTGRKWFSGGVPRSRCKFALVLGRSESSGDPHHRHSLVLVPLEAPGVRIVRSMPIFGFEFGELGHTWGEVEYNDVRIPVGNRLGRPGHGFEVVQSDLSHSRLHIAMRCVGMAERALESMCARAQSRTVFGKALSDQGVITDWIAESRLRIDQARLLALQAADHADAGQGFREARQELSMAKVASTEMAVWILDRAIQVHGAAGVTEDFGLGSAYCRLRTMRLAEGPDEVHNMVIARAELRKYKEVT